MSHRALLTASNQVLISKPDIAVVKLEGTSIILFEEIKQELDHASLRFREVPHGGGVCRGALGNVSPMKVNNSQMKFSKEAILEIIKLLREDMAKHLDAAMGTALLTSSPQVTKETVKRAC
ncbi:Hypothetical predicted protein [Olea europaea subsp. europaea]|uniref:Uncharacterized protein n=1 Tax=Olea europaea subsp. europaea TaxID=158383 RepID=A0A8S0RDB1_OLEEU|nr:Hypothetical predicted protein [Olea europaea subsp. europaea]